MIILQNYNFAKTIFSKSAASPSILFSFFILATYLLLHFQKDMDPFTKFIINMIKRKLN